jgi:hypothetical protein
VRKGKRQLSAGGPAGKGRARREKLKQGLTLNRCLYIVISLQGGMQYMEKRDIELIEKFSVVDEELKKEVEEHRKFEEILNDFNRRTYLTPEEEVEKTRIKKLKLRGRDKIEEILTKYRNIQTH